MKIVIISLFIFVSVYGSPCKVQSNGYSSIVDPVGDSCKYSVTRADVIRSRESLRAGAQFLRRFQNVADQCSCIEKCCYTKGCTLAVFENKDNHNCYLFDCRKPNKCSFVEDKEYVSMMISDQRD